MLCGIGGRTIAEAKERLTYEEFCGWIRYRNARGSLNPGMRIERSGALVAAVLTNLHQKKGSEPVSIFRFAPHLDEPALSLEQAMENWK